jgi:hypothetical protein
VEPDNSDMQDYSRSVAEGVKKLLSPEANQEVTSEGTASSIEQPVNAPAATWELPASSENVEAFSGKEIKTASVTEAIPPVDTSSQEVMGANSAVEFSSAKEEQTNHASVETRTGGEFGTEVFDGEGSSNTDVARLLGQGDIKANPYEQTLFSASTQANVGASESGPSPVPKEAVADTDAGIAGTASPVQDVADTSPKAPSSDVDMQSAVNDNSWMSAFDTPSPDAGGFPGRWRVDRALDMVHDAQPHEAESSEALAQVSQGMSATESENDDDSLNVMRTMLMSRQSLLQVSGRSRGHMVSVKLHRR